MRRAALVFKFQRGSDFGVAIFVSWNLRDPQGRHAEVRADAEAETEEGEMIARTASSDFRPVQTTPPSGFRPVFVRVFA